MNPATAYSLKEVYAWRRIRYIGLTLALFIGIYITILFVLLTSDALTSLSGCVSVGQYVPLCLFLCHYNSIRLWVFWTFKQNFNPEKVRPTSICSLHHDTCRPIPMHDLSIYFCLSVHPSVRRSVCLCLSLRLSVNMSVSVCVWLCLFHHQPVCLPVCLSVFPIQSTFSYGAVVNLFYRTRGNRERALSLRSQTEVFPTEQGIGGGRTTKNIPKTNRIISIQAFNAMYRLFDELGIFKTF